MSVFALCAVLTVSAFADTETAEYSIHADSKSNITTYNDFVLQPAVSKSVSEYEMIKELRQYPTDTLKENGFSQKEITAIKGPLKAKSKYGNITYTINYDKMYQKNGETFLRTKMTWDWSKAPICLLTDIPAMTTSETFTKDSATAKVQYYAYGNKNKKTSTSSPKVKTANAGQGVYIKLSMGKNFDVSEHSYKEIPLSGSITTSWSVSKKLKQVGIASNYGHTILSCTPSVSFGRSAAIGFTPEKRCKYGDEAYLKATLK